MSDLLLGSPNTAADIAAGGPAYILGSSGDIQFDLSGQLILVSDTDALTQNIGKILLTAQGASAIDPGYGSTLNTFIGQPYNNNGTSYPIMKQTILDAMGYLVNRDSAIANKNEQIGTVESLSVMVDPTVSTSITMNLSVTSQAGTLITVGLKI